MFSESSAQSRPIANGLQVKRGNVLVYRVFDIAEEVNLAKVEGILGRDTGGREQGRKEHGQARVRPARTVGQALVMRNAPLRFSLGEGEFESEGGGSIGFECLGTLWDYGVLSLQLRIPVRAGTTGRELLTMAERLASESFLSRAVDSYCRKKSMELVAVFDDALKTPAHREVIEDYVIYFLEEIEGIRTGAELFARPEVTSLIAALILGEARDTLSPKSRDGILENHYQYAESDLAVIDWNSAVLFEPTGQTEVADILEFALSHLLEFRYYDDLLDQRLGELYRAIQSRTKPDFRRLSAEANSRFIEFSEFLERVNNSLKVVGDFYLAVIFRAAVKRFRIQDWEGSVTRKMNLLARVSELFQGQANVQRSHLLEIIIITLIAFEIISTILKLY